jgi:hypothetical protein
MAEQPVDATPTGGDAVVGVFARGDLSSALVATHRAGFGAHARLLDAARGDLSGQLARAGFRLVLDPETDDGTSALILVTAPGRATTVSDLFARAGARAIHMLTRVTAPTTPGIALPSTVGAPPPAEEPRL